MKAKVILSAAVVTLVFQPGCQKSSVPAPAAFNVRTTVAQHVPALSPGSGATFLGVIRGDTETSLSFKVNGQLVQIGPSGDAEDWKEGTAVAAGTILAQLDTANFASAVASARARADFARAAFARNSELYAGATLAKSEFDASRAQKETAEADLAHAEQAMRDATLRAPYSGIILGRYAKTGEFAGAGRAVVRLGDFRHVVIEVGVPDTVLPHLALGQKHLVRAAAFDGEDFIGIVTEIGTAAAESTRLFRVALKLDNAAGRLRSGMTATVRLGNPISGPSHGVLVPLSALVAASRDQADSAVFVVDADNRARQRIVKTSDIVASSVVVIDGLRAGDRVVTLGAGQLFDGALVKALLRVQ